jgi:hypothetical protein
MDSPISVECEHAIVTAVEKEQSFALMHGEAARIGNTCVIAEEPTWLTVEAELQKRSVPVAIRTSRASNKEGHAHRLSASRRARATGQTEPAVQ